MAEAEESSSTRKSCTASAPVCVRTSPSTKDAAAGPRRLNSSTRRTVGVTWGASVAPVQVLLAEILLSAQLSIEGTEIGSLAKMLLQSLQQVAARKTLAANAPDGIRLRVARQTSAEPPSSPVPEHTHAMLL